MKATRILIWSVVLMLTLSFVSQAQESEPVREITSQRTGLDLIFAIDCSGSLKSNDPDRTGLGMVKTFIDTIHAEDIRIGYVAYNDRIQASLELVSIENQEDREILKQSMDSIVYSRDTDMGLGLSYAYHQMPDEAGRKRVIVLISDGETDLKGRDGRTTEQSNAELMQCVRQCQKENIQIYTIAFGTYDGSRTDLERMAEDTGAESYSAETPEKLIEVLYGIFKNVLSCKIQPYSSGVYADGQQSVHCILDEPYLDEIAVILISSGNVGETSILYGEKQIHAVNLNHYAVGKIGYGEVRDDIKELTVQTTTSAGQSLQVYVISYRSLTPVLAFRQPIYKNKDIPYQVYFRKKDGEIIRDMDFYGRFQWELKADREEGTGEEEGGEKVKEGVDGGAVDGEKKKGVDGGAVDGDKKKGVDGGAVDGEKAKEGMSLANGVMEGTVNFRESGTYFLNGILKDGLGSYPFQLEAVVENRLPLGSVPEIRCTVLSEAEKLCLNEYFDDEDGDVLTYEVTGSEDGLKLSLEGDRLFLKPERSGNYAPVIQVKDGEAVTEYELSVIVVPLWREYWWALLLLVLAAALVIGKLAHRPVPEVEKLEIENRKNRFAGKLDAYFTAQPETEEEIPPLSFEMYRVKDNQVSLGSLMREYPDACDRLGLDEITLTADEDRRMILYHTSGASVMIGNSILCKRIRYSVSFGDVIYITSEDKVYDLEIHYIAVIQ